jgi:hypothetical protein
VSTILTCSLCGRAGEVPDGGLPLGWSIETGERVVKHCCDVCTRANVRSIEAKLPEEYW